jgi:uncharacterized pyridoxamine 5'-phosphate oxidase family protein
LRDTVDLFLAIIRVRQVKTREFDMIKKKHKKKYDNTIVILENYHTLKKNQECRVLGEGVDRYLVRSRGKMIYIFKNLTE